jgi:FkbM family methyltransferase
MDMGNLKFDNEEDRRLVQISEINRLGLPIFIWGGTHTGRMMAEYLKSNGMDGDVTYVVDDEYIKAGDDLMPLSTYLASYAKNSVMIFGFYDYRIIRQKKKLYEDEIPHLYDFHFVRVYDNWLKWDISKARGLADAYQSAYDMFRDDFSRKTMEMYLRAALYGEFDELFTECYQDSQYFNGLTEHINIDTLVDCGAYDGDSIHDFILKFGDYKKIYAFEPDTENRQKLITRIETEKIHDVEVVPKGVYDKTTVLHFTSDGNASSFFDDDGDSSVEVVALDDILTGCDTNILIKMDIEGSELEALKGAAGIISTKKPALAICVYHREDDLARIPQYIDSLVERGTYDYYLRFHGIDLVELVFYAIPKK